MKEEEEEEEHVEVMRLLLLAVPHESLQEIRQTVTHTQARPNNDSQTIHVLYCTNNTKCIYHTQLLFSE